jgi:ribonucleoside-triphosphate reductase
VTKTCPNCRIAKAALDKAGIKYEVVDAEDNPDLANKYKIMQAPTLVEIRNGVANVIANASNIRTYAEKAN